MRTQRDYSVIDFGRGLPVSSTLIQVSGPNQSGDMSGEQRQQVEDLFDELHDLPAAERASRLRQVTDAAVRAEVASLLDHSSANTGDVNPAVRHFMEAVADGGMGAIAGIGPGTRFGHYRLERRLGRGGMGEVFEAVREDDFRKRVALKIVRFDLESEYAARRFQQERQVLAGLEHPNIARLLDGGEAEGCPYLVLEFVDGVSITKYCEGKPREAILRLFLKVCEAVEYAHRNLIIHRDLKPANILVNSEGEPKLLDFGIAKLLADGAEATLTMQVALTPQYASPEQVRGEAITTASDVYSLGLILYELLAGVKPYTLTTNTAVEIDRLVCQTDAPKPGISEDLDNILLMALRKDPARRYASVRELAEDIDRSLSHRPVSARPDTVRYRTGKFVRRHWSSVAAGLALTVAIAAGVAATVYQARISQQRFEQVRKLAHVFVFNIHDEIARLNGSTRARELVVSTALEYLNQLSRNAGNDLALQEELAQAYRKIGDAQGQPAQPNLGRTADAIASYRKALRLHEAMAARHPEKQAELAQFLIDFSGLKRLTGDPAGARADSQRALSILEQAAARPDASFETRMSLAKALLARGEIEGDLMVAGNYKRGNDMAVQLLAERRNRATLMLAQVSHAQMSSIYNDSGRLTLALRELDEEEKVIRDLLRMEPANPVFMRRLAVTYQDRSVVYFDDFRPSFGDPAKSVVDARSYLDVARQMADADPANAAARFSLAIAWSRLANVERFGNPEAAVREGRTAVEILSQMEKTKPSFLILSRLPRMRRILAETLIAHHDAPEALRVAEMALKESRAMLAKSPADLDAKFQLCMTLMTAGSASEAAGKAAEARQRFGESRDVAANSLPADQSDVVLLNTKRKALLALAANARKHGEPREAEKWAAEAKAVWNEYRGEPNEYVDSERKK